MSRYSIRNCSGSDLDIVTSNSSGETVVQTLYAGEVVHGLDGRVLCMLTQYFRARVLEVVTKYSDKVSWKAEGF